MKNRSGFQQKQCPLAQSGSEYSLPFIDRISLRRIPTGLIELKKIAKPNLADPMTCCQAFSYNGMKI